MWESLSLDGTIEASENRNYRRCCTRAIADASRSGEGLCLFLYPAVLGTGQRLLAVEHDKAHNLVKTQPFRSGVVLLQVQFGRR